MEQVFEQPGQPSNPKPNPVYSTASQSRSSPFRDLFTFMDRRLIFVITVLLAIIYLA